MVNTQNKGELGQLAAQWAFALNGFAISTPVSEGLPYDFIAHREPNEFVRVQAKYKEDWKLAKKSQKKGEFIYLSKKDGISKYTKDNVDIIVVYINSTDEVIFVPVEDIETLDSLTVSRSTVDKWKKFPYNTARTQRTP